MRNRSVICRTLGVTAGLVLSVTATAAIQTLDGNGFVVRYDDSLLGLYGNPTLSGDGLTILFTPTAFSAQSSGVQGLITTSSSVYLDITPDGGDRLVSVHVTEAGDYKVVDRGTGGIAPEVDIFGEGRLTSLFDGTQFVVGSLTHTPLTNVCVTLSCSQSDWTANTSVSAPMSWGTSAARFLLQNTLQAESEQAGDSAFIQKKQSSTTISVTVNTSPVPLPAALPLLLSGIGLVGALKRRRQRA